MAHVRQCKIPDNVHMRSFLQVISYVLTDGDTSLTLGAVLAFATGLKRIPAVGFPIGPRLEFLHEEDGPALFPTANTCSLVLRLPVYPEYNRFKEAMEEGITSCGSTFGVA